jgi:hypothetical protein
MWPGPRASSIDGRVTELCFETTLPQCYRRCCSLPAALGGLIGHRCEPALGASVSNTWRSAIESGPHKFPVDGNGPYLFKGY